MIDEYLSVMAFLIFPRVYQDYGDVNGTQSFS